MSIIYDTSTTSASGASKTVVVANQPNRIILCYCSGDGTAPTYNGVALTKKGDYGIRTSLWYLVNPAVGSHTMTFPGDYWDSGDYITTVGWGVVFNNVNTVSPFGGTTSATGNPYTTSTATTNFTPSYVKSGIIEMACCSWQTSGSMDAVDVGVDLGQLETFSASGLIIQAGFSYIASAAVGVNTNHRTSYSGNTTTARQYIVELGGYFAGPFPTHLQT